MRLRRSIALVLVTFWAIVPGAAWGAAPAFAKGTASVTTPSINLQSAGQQAQTATATTATTATTSTSSGGFSTTDGLIIAAIALIVLVGIVLYIVIDARSRTRGVSPRTEYDLDHGPGSGSKPPKKPRKLSAAEKKRRKRGRAPRKRRN